MTPYMLLRMPAGDRAPALRQHALRRLGELEQLEAEIAAKIERCRHSLERLARLARHHHVDLPAAVVARINLPKGSTNG